MSSVGNPVFHSNIVKRSNIVKKCYSLLIYWFTSKASWANSTAFSLAQGETFPLLHQFCLLSGNKGVKQLSFLLTWVSSSYLAKKYGELSFTVDTSILGMWRCWFFCLPLLKCLFRLRKWKSAICHHNGKGFVINEVFHRQEPFTQVRFMQRSLRTICKHVPNCVFAYSWAHTHVPFSSAEERFHQIRKLLQIDKRT